MAHNERMSTENRNEQLSKYASRNKTKRASQLIAFYDLNKVAVGKTVRGKKDVVSKKTEIETSPSAKTGSSTKVQDTANSRTSVKDKRNDPVSSGGDRRKARMSTLVVDRQQESDMNSQIIETKASEKKFRQTIAVMETGKGSDAEGETAAAPAKKAPRASMIVGGISIMGSGVGSSKGTSKNRNTIAIVERPADDH